MECLENLLEEKQVILNLLPIGYEYVLKEYQFQNDQEFIAFINIRNILTEEKAKIWIKELSESTLTMWRVQRTYPTSSRCNVYKIAMKCQHNVNHKFIKEEERKKQHISKHTGCPSNLVLTIKRYVKHSKAKKFNSSDPSLIEWPCFVLLKFVHNHPLNSTATLRFKPLCYELKEKLLNLFKKGHKPASALESIKMELFLDDCDKYYDLAEDRSIVPTISQVQYLFNQTFNTKGIQNEEKIFDLGNIVDGLIINNVCKAKCGEIQGKHFVSLCTSIMSRAHALLPHSCELVIFENNVKSNKRGINIYFLESPTPAGSIPLGCIISEGDGPDILNAALIALKQCFPSPSFYTQSYSNIFLCSDIADIQNILKNNWPQSSFILSQCCILRNAWSWLNCNNNVPKSMRENVYYSVKNLIYCTDEKNLFQLYTLLIDKYKCSLPIFVSYISTLWLDRHKWSSAYRTFIPVGENCLFNYIDITFKIMRECFIERIKYLDIIQVVDFINVHYEKYIKLRLLDFIDGRVIRRLLYKYIAPINIINPSTIIQCDKDVCCYFVPSESDYNLKYMVDTKHCLCSCDRGKNGQICKHLCGVINQIDDNYEIPEISQEFKQMLHQIAIGKDLYIKSLVNPDILSPSQETSIKNSEISVNNSLHHSLTDQEETQLQDFFTSINMGLKNKPNLYVPAIKCLLQNYTKMKSNNEFVSALKNFGLPENTGSKNKFKKLSANLDIETKRNKSSKTQIRFTPIAPKIKLVNSMNDPLNNIK